MPRRHIRDIAKLKGALILSGEWSGAPGRSGRCGLAVSRHNTGFQIWNWEEAGGLEKLALVRSHSWREVITRVAIDAIGSGVVPRTIQIDSDAEGWGALLSLAWQDDEQSRRRLSVMLRLDDDTLRRFSNTPGLQTSKLRSVVDSIATYAEELDIDLEELSDRPTIKAKSISDAKKQICSQIEQARDEGAIHLRESRRVSLVEKPFKEVADKICSIWRRSNPPVRGGGMSIPRLGYESLRGYVIDWMKAHGSAPRGKHLIHGRLESFNRQAADAEIDFDPYLSEIFSNSQSAIPGKLRIIARAAVERCHAGLPPPDGIADFYTWLESDGFEALQESSADMVGVFINDVAEELFSDKNVRDWLGVPLAKQLSDAERAMFIRERISEGVETLGEYRFPSIFRFSLIAEDGRSAIVGGYALLHGQAGLKFTWLGVFADESQLHDRLAEVGIRELDEFEELTDAELLQWWHR